MADQEVRTDSEVGASGTVGMTVFSGNPFDVNEPSIQYEGGWLTARLDSSGLSLRLVGSASYVTPTGRRTVQVDIEPNEPDMDAIRRALQDVLERETPALNASAANAAARAIMAAEQDSITEEVTQ